MCIRDRDNICHVLNNFLACSAFENVVFCWVMHQQAIWDALAARLHTQGWQVVRAALVCAPETLRARVEGDASRAPDAAARLSLIHSFHHTPPSGLWQEGGRRFLCAYQRHFRSSRKKTEKEGEALVFW